MVSEISGLYELKGVKYIPGESNVFVNECDLSKETITCKVKGWSYEWFLRYKAFY